MLFTFPSRYWFAIGLLRVFSLGGWARRIHTGFLVSRATQDTTMLSTRFRLRGCHPLWRCFPAASPTESSCNLVVLQPRHGRNRGGLGSSPFARHYLGNHCYFLFLQVLRCFSSLGSLSALQSDRTSFCRVVPFGNLRVTGHLRLTGAYRSLSRPSSPVRA